MATRRQASGAVDFVTDVVTRTFSLLVKVTLVILLLWAIPTFGPKILEFIKGPTASKVIEFAYMLNAPLVQANP